jgi:uncharacterized protein YbaA (DUF1428 family)
VLFEVDVGPIKQLLLIVEAAIVVKDVVDGKLLLVDKMVEITTDEERVKIWARVPSRKIRLRGEIMGYMVSGGQL